MFDNISFIGDCLDLSEWSLKYLPEPEFFWTTMPALLEWAWWLALYRQAQPTAEMDQYEGNHDIRPEIAIKSHLKAAYSLRAVDELELPGALSIARLLALHQLKVNYIAGYPDNTKWLNRNILVRHGDVVRSGSGDTAKAVVNKTNYTTIFGHIHRRELVARRIKNRDGFSVYTAFCPGCACHVDGRVPGSMSESQWQQGIAVIEYTEDSETIIPIPIDNGSAIYNGRVWTARERDAEVNSMLKDKLNGMLKTQGFR